MELESEDRLCERGDCPGRERLRAYVSGDLPEAEIERVSACTTDCQQCQDTLVALESSTDDLLRRWRDAVHEAEGTRADDGLEPLVARAAAIRLEGGSAATLARETQGVTSQCVPERIGQYRILERIGAGGMGTVYRAEHERLQRVVALKLIADHRNGDPTAIARFVREMQAIGRVRHKNIVSATDAGEEQGRHYLVMELIEGADVASLVNRHGPLRIADACDIIRQAALGLEHVHQHGIIHRDVKPSNLMISREGEVKVLDLGLARLFETRCSDLLSGSGHIVGTLDYIAPEQLAPGGEVDVRTDVYALGCTLFTLLTGRPPFSGPEHDEPLKKIAAHAQQAPPTVDEIRSDVPVELVANLAKMLAKLPAERYSSAADVAKAMEPFAVGADLERLVESVEVTGTTSGNRPVAVNASGRSGEGQGRWRRPLIALIAVVALFIAAAYQYGATVFRIVTNRGTLLVEISDHAFEGQWQDEKLIIRERGSERSYTIELKSQSDSKDLPAGSYLTVSDSEGLRVEPAAFTISRGGQTRVRVVPDNSGSPDRGPVVVADPASAELVPPLFVVEWETPKIITEQPQLRRGIADGRQYNWVEGSNGWWSWSVGRSVGVGILEVEARVKEGFHGGCLVNLANQENGDGVCVVLDHTGRFIVRPSLFRKDPTVGRNTNINVTHTAIRAAGDFNRLRIVINDRSAEFLVNGERVCSPVEFDRELPPLIVGVGIVGGGKQGAAHVEYERIVFWPTTDLTQIAEPNSQR